MRRFIGATAPLAARPYRFPASPHPRGDAEERWRALQGLGNDLGEILHGQGFLNMDPANAILEHLEAEGARTSDHVCFRGNGLLGPHKIDFAWTVLIHPGVATACTTTQSPFTIMRHFHRFHTRNLLQDIARCLVDAVMPPQVA